MPNGVGKRREGSDAMVSSKCPKCENGTFEMVDVTLNNAKFPTTLVQCTSCGTVVGITDYENVVEKLKRIEELLKRISR